VCDRCFESMRVVCEGCLGSCVKEHDGCLEIIWPRKPCSSSERASEGLWESVLERARAYESVWNCAKKVCVSLRVCLRACERACMRASESAWECVRGV
jgi:hypothetical protein